MLCVSAGNEEAKSILNSSYSSNSSHRVPRVSRSWGAVVRTSGSPLAYPLAYEPPVNSCAGRAYNAVEFAEAIMQNLTAAVLSAIVCYCLLLTNSIEVLGRIYIDTVGAGWVHKGTRWWWY